MTQIPSALSIHLTEVLVFIKLGLNTRNNEAVEDFLEALVGEIELQIFDQVLDNEYSTRPKCRLERSLHMPEDHVAERTICNYLCKAFLKSIKFVCLCVLAHCCTPCHKTHKSLHVLLLIALYLIPEVPTGYTKLPSPKACCSLT